MDNPTIGHNSGSTAPIGPALSESLKIESLDLLKRFEELKEASARCPAPQDEETAAKVTDFIRILNAFIKTADGRREAAKAPYLDGGRLVDGFFKSMTDPMETAKKQASSLLTLYQRKKADEERRKREEEARIKREEEERLRKEAEERAAAAATMADMQSAIEVEEKAETALADRLEAEKEAAAPAAELSRTRGEYGGTSSLRTLITFADMDRAALDLEALRPYIPVDGLEKAIRAYIKAGGRELKGARIYETTSAVVR